MSAKCPRCKKSVTELKGYELSATFGGGKKWKAAAYICPSCNSILGCQINPVALNRDLINELVKTLVKELSD
jgi:transposase-like protein